MRIRNWYPMAAISVLFACATITATSPPRTSTEELARNAVAELSSAYESRDERGFMALVSARYLDGYGDLQARLENSLDTASSIEVEIVPERIWTGDEKNEVFMDARWKKTRMTGSNRPPEVTAGRVTFIFIRSESDVLKLFSQGGDRAFP